jgi:hypothetical protein
MKPRGRPLNAVSGLILPRLFIEKNIYEGSYLSINYYRLYIIVLSCVN